MIAVCATDSPDLALMNYATGEVLGSCLPPSGLGSPRPSRFKFASSGTLLCATWSDKGHKVAFYEYAQGEAPGSATPVAEATCPDVPTAIAFSPDEQKCAIGRVDDTTMIIDLCRAVRARPSGSARPVWGARAMACEP